jgi:hypothetical protein
MTKTTDRKFSMNIKSSFVNCLLDYWEYNQLYCNFLPLLKLKFKAFVGKK